jgi:trigger factor
MQLQKEQITPTKLKLTIAASAEELQAAKQATLGKLSNNVKVPGFRPGKAPVNMLEKHVDPAVLQSEVLDQLIGQLYFESVQSNKLRPVAQPEVSLTKFVPYTTLEFTAEVDVIGAIKLGDYKKVQVAKKPTEVTAKDVNEVLENLRQRAATKQDVDREAKTGDELVIDFSGVDAKTKEPIQGADGKDYPLVLGSDTFIPGFEKELVGAKSGAVTTFDLTFPADYGVAALQSKQVTFTVTVRAVRELALPKLDDDFAASVGPFKTVAELKADIKKQLASERDREADQQRVNELLEKITSKSELEVPDSMIDEEITRLEEEEKRNLIYRGQTWEEHLAEEGITAEAHREKQRQPATLRVKSGLVLAEIAEAEAIVVSPEELEVRIQLLKGQYQDPAMQAELDKPENRRDIHSRMLTEKTIDKLLSYQK